MSADDPTGPSKDTENDEPNRISEISEKQRVLKSPDHFATRAGDDQRPFYNFTDI